MDISTIYTDTSDEAFQLPAGVRTINFTEFAELPISHNPKWYIAMTTIGTVYNKNHSAVNFPVLRGGQVSDCPARSTCFEMNLYQSLYLDQSLHNSSATFITIEKMPFYHIRLDLDSTFRFESTENCKWYGIGGPSGGSIPIAYCICAVHVKMEKGSSIALGTHQTPK